MSKMYEEIFEQPAVLKGLQSESGKVCRELVRHLKKKKITTVVFASRGSSDHAAIFGQYMFAKYCGAVCALATPSVITKYHAAPNFAGTLVIGISQSGQAVDVIEVLEAAKRCGAVTASITNDSESPLSKLSDFPLLCNAGAEHSVAATKTFTAQLFCLAQIAAIWSGDSELKKELTSVPSVLKKNIGQLSEEMARIAPKYSYMTEGFVLARGMLYPIALEAALKIKETNYIKMQGAASSDFYHGPFAQIDSNLPTILLAFNGPCFDDAAEMALRLHEADADVMCFTDNEQLAITESCVFCKNAGTDITGAFLAAVMVQLFACHLASARGKNPDEPRFLNKVTITR